EVTPRRIWNNGLCVVVPASYRRRETIVGVGQHSVSKRGIRVGILAHGVRAVITVRGSCGGSEEGRNRIVAIESDSGAGAHVASGVDANANRIQQTEVLFVRNAGHHGARRNVAVVAAQAGRHAGVGCVLPGISGREARALDSPLQDARVLAVAAVEGDPAGAVGDNRRRVLAPEAALCVSKGAISSASAAVTACLVVRSMASRAATAAVFVRAHDVVVRDIAQDTDYVSRVSGGGATGRGGSGVALGANRGQARVGSAVRGGSSRSSSRNDRVTVVGARCPVGPNSGRHSSPCGGCRRG